MQVIETYWKALFHQRTLRSKLIALLGFSFGFAVLVAAVLMAGGASYYLRRDAEANLASAHTALMDAVQLRVTDNQRIVNALAFDMNLAADIDAVASREAGSTVPAELKARQHALSMHLARINPGSNARLLVYNRDGEVLNEDAARHGRDEKATRNPTDKSEVDAGRVALPTMGHGAVWRLVDGEPCLIVSAPISLDTASAARRVGYLALVLGGVADAVREPGRYGRYVDVSWVLPNRHISGALTATPDEETLRDAPVLTADNPGRIAVGAGRFQTAQQYSQALRLPVDAGPSPFIVLSVDKRAMRAPALVVLGGALLAFGIAACLAIPFTLWLAHRAIVQPVEKLADAARALNAGNHLALTAASEDWNAEQGEIGNVQRALGELAIGWRQRAQESDLWSAVFEKTREAIFITDIEGTVLFANQALTDVTGREADTVLGRIPNCLRSNLHDEGFYSNVWKALRESGHWSGEVWDQRSDGSSYPQWLSMTAITDKNGHTTHYVGIFSDISERKAQEERINFMAHHDALTSLPNRTLLLDRLALAMIQAEREEHQVGLLFIDLDRFKYINDTLGHTTGDGLLQAVAERLKRAVRASDTVCRLGGDEFIVVLHKIRELQDAALIAEHILAILAPITRVDGHDLSITPSIGISIFPTDAREADELIRNADVAMYYAKSQGRNNFQVFRPVMTEMAAEHLSLEHSLRQAVDRDEFTLSYQPQIDIATRRMMSVEALIRWNSPDFGPVSPAKFIPIAEECGLILQIGDWVMREACRQRAEWTEHGIDPFPIAVNVSALQFRQPDFARRVQEALQLFGVTSDQLELELTESIVMREAEITSRTLGELKQLGVSMSIDDFGTGYSSLGYLKRLPIEKLKIDASFVRDLETDQADRAIVEAIVSLGRALNLTLVAEGVEKRSTLGILSKLGCHMAQGYYYCQPMPARPFEAWFRDFSSGGNRRLHVA